MMAATQKVRLRTLVGHGDEDEERDNEDVEDEGEGEGEGEGEDEDNDGYSSNETLIARMKMMKTTL